MKRTSEQTALLVALLLKRSGNKRARVSDKTIRRLSNRRTLRDAFKSQLRSELDDLGIHLVELERGGFGIIPISSLDGAPAITAKRYLAEEMKLLANDNGHSFDDFRREVEDDADEFGGTDE